jgi:hypothetical protein
MSDTEQSVLAVLGSENVLDSFEYKELLEQHNTVSAQLTTVVAENSTNISALAKTQENLSKAQSLISDLEESVSAFHGDTELRQTPMSYSVSKANRQHWKSWQNQSLVYEADDFGFSFEDRKAHHGAFMAHMRKRTSRLLQYYHAMGQATCQYPPCSSKFLLDIVPNTLSAIVCPRCCNVLYCSLHCMSHHSHIHGLSCAPSIAWNTEVHKTAKRKQPSTSDDEDTVVELTAPPTPDTVKPVTPNVTTTATARTVVKFGQRVPSTVVTYQPPNPTVSQPAEIPATPTITFPTTTNIFVDASTLNWLEETWEADNKQYWSAPELPTHFFYWQYGQSCYFTVGDTLKRMTSDYGLYIVSKQQDDQEREANRLAKATTGKGKGGKGGKGKTGKGGKGKSKGKG